MEDIPEIPGRSTEIEKVYTYLQSKIKSKKPGILYIKGQPGTGKSMTIMNVIRHMKGAGVTYINCLKHRTAKTILAELCDAAKIKVSGKSDINDVILDLSKKFASPKSISHIIVFDEMDSVPKARSGDLIRQIFLWTKVSSSKLIVIGIANTLNMTSRSQNISSLLGQDEYNFDQIPFKTYNSKDILAILRWYLENDEFFEDVEPDEKALDMIAKKSARDKGDIRGALNSLRSLADDTRNAATKLTMDTSYPTPPTTPPPMTPCKDKTNRMSANIASVVKSTRKRQKEHGYMEDTFPFAHQVILTVIYKLTLASAIDEADTRLCIGLANAALPKFGLECDRQSLKAILTLLETQGWISSRKNRKERLMIRITEQEFDNLVKRKEVIMDTLDTIKISQALR